MLKLNSSKFVPSISVHLEFDDNTTKEFIVSLNEYVSVSFMKNGQLTTLTGKVIKIDPNNGVFELDYSTEYDSNIDWVRLEYITDITKVIINTN